MQQTVVFDFDGVIHSYTSGWQGAEIIPDPPVKGIKEAIDSIREAGYRVVIVSTRNSSQSGLEAVGQYLFKHNIVVDAVQAEKPPAIVYIDDRAICFDGKPEMLLSEIQNFVPWNKLPDIKDQLPFINITITLYFKVVDSLVFGGPGSEGYTSVNVAVHSNRISLDQRYLDSQKSITAQTCGVPVDKVFLITKEEYDEASEEEDDCFYY